jgi:hypothetical protein
MRGAFWLALLSALPFVGRSAAAADAPAEPHALSASGVYARLAPSVWVVRTYDQDNLRLGQGSAVAIGPENLVTNCHVLKKARRVEVSHEGTALPATLELWDVGVDLCQLRVPGLPAPAVELAEDASLQVGQPVYALGAPQGLELTLSSGLISSLRVDPKTHQIGLIQTSAPISPGSSGGGLFDEFGRLVGITTAMIAAENAQNLNLARPVGMVRDLPRRHAEAHAATVSLAASPSTPSHDAAPQTVGTLVGRWVGEMQCGPFLGSAPNPRKPGPWTAPLRMTVTDTGSTLLERSGKNYSETLSGSIRSDLSATMSGQGADFDRPSLTWRNEVVGRFSGNGEAAQFSGTAELGTTRGELGRHCTVSLAKSR